MSGIVNRRTFVLEDTTSHDYRYVCTGLLRRGWQQIKLPRRQPQEGVVDAQGRYCPDRRKHLDQTRSCWVQQRNAIGVASAGQRDVLVPDLIWTLSCGRLPGLGGLGKGQVVNFFDGSSCLTTKVRFHKMCGRHSCSCSESVIAAKALTGCWLFLRAYSILTNLFVFIVGRRCAAGVCWGNPWSCVTRVQFTTTIGYELI